jgi:membrane associated rhomboid family serine protease
MGIYDRDYYRREGSGFLAFANRGAVCKWLIAINVGVFVLQTLTTPVVENHRPAGGSFVTDAFVLDRFEVYHGQVWRLLTYAFLHFDIWHILFNMLFLWWFGSDMEDLLGPREFLAFYLMAAFLGGIGFMLTGLASPINGLCLGASGAVTAVLVLCAFYYPSRIIYVYFLPIPVWAFVGFQVVRDAYVFFSGATTTTAVSVHLTGALFGFLYFKRRWRLMDSWADVQKWVRRRRQPRLKVYREEPVLSESRPASSRRGESEELLEAKLDAILQKVAATGQESLTESERELLLKASEIYKRRRT